MLGSESAIEGASAVSVEGRIVLVESEGSNIVPMMSGYSFRLCLKLYRVFRVEGVFGAEREMDVNTEVQRLGHGNQS